MTNGRPGKRPLKAFLQCAIEMRHEGNHHVRLRLLPVRLEQPHRRPVIHANDRLQHAHDLRAAQRPAALQHRVVNVLDADAGVFPDNVERIEQFLQVREANFPRTPLRLNGHLQGCGGRAMAAPGVEETELNPLHARPHSDKPSAVLCCNLVKRLLQVSKLTNSCIFTMLALLSSSCKTSRNRVFHMKCDLHVHSYFSGLCTTPFVRKFCRESYSDPREVYAVLKERGMNLVTLTEHDSIESAEVLRKHKDFFVSEEVTCRMPSGSGSPRRRLRPDRAPAHSDSAAPQ